MGGMDPLPSPPPNGCERLGGGGGGGALSMLISDEVPACAMACGAGGPPAPFMKADCTGAGGMPLPMPGNAAPTVGRA